MRRRNFYSQCQYFLIAILLIACRGEPYHSFGDAWRTLPAEMQGEVQGLPAHWASVGTEGAVSTANALASEAAIQMLQAGGNAIDALLAAQWVLAVTEPQSSGLGGGGFLLYYQAKSKRVYALDGREEAPSGIDETIFLTKENKPMPFLMRVEGARAVGVPGTVALMEYAKKRFGNSQIPFARTFESALKMARQGIRVSSRLSQAMHLNRARFLKQNRGYNPYLHSDKPYNVGEILYQDDLANTLALLAQEGAAAFYEGAIAKDILATVKHHPVVPSTMTDSDLKNYRVVERPVAVRRIGKNSFYSVSAPASGAYTLAAVTNVPQSANEVSLLKASLAAQRQSFIQREKTLEDPDWNLAKKKQSTPEKSHAHESENTTHVSIVDAEGNIVSYTASVEMSMGSALFVQGRGFILNNELTDFTPIPKRVNAVEQGKRGRVTALNAEARETVGGKRPKSSMSPLIFEREDGTFFALGSPGGPTIVGVNALVAARLLRREELTAAVLAPRAIAMPSGHIIAELVIKQNRELVEALHRSGFPIDTTRKIISLGSVQAVSFNPKTNTYRAVSDLRREGLALVAKPKVD